MVTVYEVEYDCCAGFTVRTDDDRDDQDRTDDDRDDQDHTDDDRDDQDRTEKRSTSSVTKSGTENEKSGSQSTAITDFLFEGCPMSEECFVSMFPIYMKSCALPSHPLFFTCFISFS